MEEEEEVKLTQGTLDFPDDFLSCDVLTDRITNKRYLSEELFQRLASNAVTNVITGGEIGEFIVKNPALVVAMLFAIKDEGKKLEALIAINKCMMTLQN